MRTYKRTVIELDNGDHVDISMRDSEDMFDTHVKITAPDEIVIARGLARIVISVGHGCDGSEMGITVANGKCVWRRFDGSADVDQPLDNTPVDEVRPALII